MRCQPSTGLFPRNGHPLEDCTAEEPMDELIVEPDAEEPKRKRKRRRKRAVHVSSRQDDSNPQDSVEPAHNHDTEVQGFSSKRPKNASSKRPHPCGTTFHPDYGGRDSPSISSDNLWKLIFLATEAPSDCFEFTGAIKIPLFVYLSIYLSIYRCPQFTATDTN